MSAGATSVLEAPDLQLPDELFPELVYLANADNEVLGSAPAEAWTRFELYRESVKFEIDTAGRPCCVLSQEGSPLAQVAGKHWLKPGDVFILTP